MRRKLIRRTAEDEDRRTRVMSVPCPVCGRSAGRTCYGGISHQARWVAWYAAHPEAAVTRQHASQELWRCEDCGWIWPLKRAPYQDAECDACGGTMVPEDHPLTYTEADRAYDRDVLTRDYGLRP